MYYAKYMYAKAPWRWTNEEFNDVAHTITNIKTPTGHGSSIKKKITTDWKVIGMKTHDWYNLLQDLLPMAVQGTLTPDVRETVYRLGQLFRWIFLKDIKISDISKMREQAVELACHLEMYFFPRAYCV